MFANTFRFSLLLLLATSGSGQSKIEVRRAGVFYEVGGWENGQALVWEEANRSWEPTEILDLRKSGAADFYPAYANVEFYSVYSPTFSRTEKFFDMTMSIAASRNLTDVWMAYEVRNTKKETSQWLFMEIGDLDAAVTKLKLVAIPSGGARRSEFTMTPHFFVGARELVTNYTEESERWTWAHKIIESYLGEIGQGSSPPKALLFPTVALTVKDLENRATEEVKLTCELSADGKITGYQVVESSNEDYEARAIDSLKYAHFFPHVVEGNTLPSRINIKMRIGAFEIEH